MSNPHGLDFERDVVPRVQRLVDLKASDFARSSRLDKDDLAQDIWVALLRAWPSYDPARSSISTWAWNVASWAYRGRLSAERKTGIVCTFSDLQAAMVGRKDDDRFGSGGQRFSREAESNRLPSINPEQAIHNAIDAHQLAAQFRRRLTHRQYMVFILSFAHDLTRKEIGELLGIPEGDALRALESARQRLRRYMDARPRKKAQTRNGARTVVG